MATLGAEVERSEEALKHLGFVKMLAINAMIVVLKLYGYVKQKSGPLKPIVGMGEHVVAAVVGPFYYKFKQVPNHILLFFDNKVDEAFLIFDKRAPPIAKNVVSKVKKLLFSAEETKVESPVAAATSNAGNISKEAFDKLKLVPLMVKKASDLAQEGPLAPISHALPIPKGVVSKAKKASDLVPEGPVATISHVGKISKKNSHMFDLSSLPIAKGVGSLVKKTSDLVQEGPVATISEASKISHIFDGAALPIAKNVGSLVKKTSDLAQEGPIAGKISKEVSHIFDEAALPIAKGVGSMVKKASGLVQEGPVAAISYAGKVSKEASHIFDEYAPPIAKNVVSNASDLVHVARVRGPFAAISHFGQISKEFAMRQLVTMWYKANQYSFLFGILEIVIPIVAYLLKKYNSLVKHLKRKGWFRYVPLVPVEEMELAYKAMEAAAAAAKKSSELVEKAAAVATRFNDNGSELD